MSKPNIASAEEIPAKGLQKPVVCIGTPNGLAGNAISLCLQNAAYRCVLAFSKPQIWQTLASLTEPVVVLVDGSGYGPLLDTVVGGLNTVTSNSDVALIVSNAPESTECIQQESQAIEDLFVIPIERDRILAVVSGAAERLAAAVNERGSNWPYVTPRHSENWLRPELYLVKDFLLETVREKCRLPLLRSLVRFRDRRAGLFQGELFTDPCWDMLLDLKVNELQGRVVSVSSLCIASRVPPTTALRRIDDLINAGWAERRNDPDDRRRVFIQLTRDASARLDLYLDGIMLTRLPKWTTEP